MHRKVKPHTRNVNGKKVLVRSHIRKSTKVGHLTDSDVQFLDYINQFALKPINYRDPNVNTRWLSERIAEQKSNPIWQNLSTETKSAELFKLSPQDPTEGTFFVKVWYLTSIAGNRIGGLGKEKSIKGAYTAGIKLETPQVCLRDGDVGEGNHRIFVASQFGYNSVPVRIYWKG